MKPSVGWLAMVAAVLAGYRGEALAQSGRVRASGVFAPSPPPAVMNEEIEPPLINFDITGRGADAYPRLDGEVTFEIQNNYTPQSEDNGRETNYLTTSNDLYLIGRATSELFLQAALGLQNVKDPQPGENGYFANTGLVFETLGLYYQADNVALFGGKFNPTFGVAWDLAPGIYAADLADDYELTERIGIGGSLTFGSGEVGEHTLFAQTFFLDTSVLSQSFGTQRGRTRAEDGGVSNTQSFQSFSATLDGEVPRSVDGLRYQLGIERQQHGRSEPNTEWGVAAALYGGFELAEETEINPLIEWVRLRNREGEPNTVDYLTLGAGLFVDSWSRRALLYRTVHQS